MSADPTEAIRRIMVAQDRMFPQEREAIEAESGGPTYDTKELQEEFEVLSFLAPYVSVRRRADGVRGSMQFQHDPRIYFGFKAS